MQPDHKHQPTTYLLDCALGRRTVIQHTALSGFRHHEAPKLWGALRKNETLTLERDSDNPHDQDAVAICWKGRKLGYLPRDANFVVARLLDSARTLSARIEELSRTAPPNQRVRVKVFVH